MMFGNVMQPMPGGMGDNGPTMQLPQSMPGGPIFGRQRMGPMQGAALGALGGAMRGMTPGLPMGGMMNIGGQQFDPQLLAALLGR
ncbi:MAG: hypothetical protein ING29_11370 [Azospirillum sp.]|jgi:hypothetical protein|nr:hypothetical protein [Azospirillum sp.]